MTLPADNQLLSAIGMGLYDTILDEMASSISRRRAAVAAAKAAELQIGDHFIIGRITPKALSGVRAEVVGFKGSSIECILLETVCNVGRRGTYHYGHQITIPTSCVQEKVYSA